jgi:Domain of unknown function (DUF1707)
MPRDVYTRRLEALLEQQRLYLQDLANDGKGTGMFKVVLEDGRVESQWHTPQGAENAARKASASGCVMIHDGTTYTHVYTFGSLALKLPAVAAVGALPEPLERRVGDAERFATLDELGTHFARGVLTQQEWDARSGRALKARTAAALEKLTADLPALPEPAAPVPHSHPLLSFLAQDTVWLLIAFLAFVAGLVIAHG